MPDVQLKQCAANVRNCRKEAEMNNNQKITILYERLSRDDGEDGISNSIVNQRKLLEDYAEKHGFTPFIHISDDGHTGTNFKRPGWQELIAQVEADRVSAIIVKNLDRMGRNYLQTGLYREMFQERGVRLIAVSDGIDTFAKEDDFVPFREIMAEWYARDTSKKIRAIFNARTQDGKHVTGAIPYGYLHDPDDCQKWIIDESAADVVRRIFRMVIDGHGVYQIAGILEREKVPIPTAHWKEIGCEDNARHSYKDPYRWRGGVVGGILQKREYMGHLVLRKTYNASYKSKKRTATPADEQLVFEGAIPQIIDDETWHNAQRLRRTVRRPHKNGDPPYRLTGLLICADCGKKLTHARNFDFRKNRERDEYICGNYRQGTQNCTMHYVRTVVIEEIILSVIKRVGAFVRENEAEFAEKVREMSVLRHESDVRESRKKLNKSERRRNELDGLIKKLYETYAVGKLPENHFERMLAEYDKEQQDLRSEIADLQGKIDVFTADGVKADRFIELVRRYTNFDKLNTSMLNEFVEKIVVHEGDKSSGRRVQKLDVYLNFIGKFDVPEPERTVEELEAEHKREARLAKDRERRRQWRERRKIAEPAFKIGGKSI